MATRTGYEAGLVTVDDYRHAVVRRLIGASAVCGAGRIVVSLTGRFDPASDDACAACVTRTAADRVPPPA